MIKIVLKLLFIIVVQSCSFVPVSSQCRLSSPALPRRHTCEQGEAFSPPSVSWLHQPFILSVCACAHQCVGRCVGFQHVQACDCACQGLRYVNMSVRARACLVCVCVCVRTPVLLLWHPAAAVWSIRPGFKSKTLVLYPHWDRERQAGRGEEEEVRGTDAKVKT